AEETLLELGEVDAGAQIAQLHGKVRVLHLPRHRLFEALLKAERRVDVQLDAWNERGDEEGKALDVVPVRVADEQVQVDRRLQRLREMQAQLAGAGAAIEHDDGAVRRADLRAGRVAAEARGAFPGRGDRPTSPPEPDVHDAPPG